MLKNIAVDEACMMLHELPVELCSETVPLGESLLRTLSDTVRAVTPIPPFDKSPYDGYAFRGADTAGATRERPAILPITEEIPAGKQPMREVTQGAAAKILTGAPIPQGADSTIKYEFTEYTDSHVSFFEPVLPNTDIIRAGSVIKRGEALAQKGALITPPVISALADQGMAAVDVFKKPRIAVICTGSELCEAGQALRPASIYNSNVHTISAYLRTMGAEPEDAGIVPDVPEEIAGRIGDALKGSDMVVTTGGASVGDYDWAVESALLIKAEILFWKARMRPGGAILAAVRDGKLILSLSGSPGAAALGLLRIAAPYVKKLCGRAERFYPEITAELKEPFKKSSPKLRVLRGKLEIIDGRAYFAEGVSQGSEAAASLAGCDLLGEIPEGSPPLPAGTMIKAYRIPV